MLCQLLSSTTLVPGCWLCICVGYVTVLALSISNKSVGPSTLISFISWVILCCLLVMYESLSWAKVLLMTEELDKRGILSFLRALEDQRAQNKPLFKKLALGTVVAAILSSLIYWGISKLTQT